MKIKIGIVGYGNLGKGVESEIANNPDMELVGVFTRRDPKSIKTQNAKVYSIDDALKMQNEIDVMILCAGSATDLPKMTPEFAKHFNVIDSFDNHSNIPQHFKAVNETALKSEKVAIISVGWDPGLFSLNRLLSGAILPKGKTYTFWGKGVSQGHSDAIRRIEGVKDAKQYTIPQDSALKQARSGAQPNLTTRQKHLRECYVVVEDGADKEKIEQQIKTMPNYFADYDTIVHFISQQELNEQHSGYPHGGFVIHSGSTGNGNNHIIEYKIQLDSNPQFTASVLIAYARAAYKANQRGEKGCKTILILLLLI